MAKNINNVTETTDDTALPSDKELVTKPENRPVDANQPADPAPIAENTEPAFLEPLDASQQVSDDDLPQEDPATVPSQFAEHLEVVTNPDAYVRVNPVGTENTEGEHIPLSAGLGGTYTVGDDGIRRRTFEEDTPNDDEE